MPATRDGKTWCCQFYYEDWQGVRHKKNKRGFKTKAEAEEWERNFRQQQRKDLDINFENFVEIYFADVEKRLRESTIKNKRYVFDLKVTPYFKKKKMCEIKTSDPGDGKTTLVLNIAAKLSKGECLDSDMDVQEPVNVIYQTAEDGLADTVKPRLEIAGADCEKILVIDESDKSLSMADERLEEALAKTEAKVLILDPIQAYLGGGMDMNRANEARDMTKKLGALAEKYQCAILLIGHMNKASGNKAAYRGRGSIDFFAVARSVLLVGRIEGEPNTRAVVQIKNNLAAFGHPKAFMLSEMGFHWLGDYEITADEVLGGIAPKANKLEQAKQMLRELAETTNMVQSNEVFEMADERGISKRTMENAKKELGIRAKKINNSWYWELDTVKQR